MPSFFIDPSVPAVFLGIVLLTFVSEDAAAVFSALLVLGGPVAWPVGFVSCFVGIWVGDLGIYALARWGGRPLLRSRWIKKRINPGAVVELERKFARHAKATLFASRFLPGTRVITYLAAGLFSMPLARFAAVTGGAVLLWVTAIFGLTKLLGDHALTWFSGTQSKVGAIVFTALCLVAIVALFRAARPLAAVAEGLDPGSVDVIPSATNGGHRPRLQAPRFVRRWIRWEFWPAWLFYLPVAIYYIWLAIRYRSFSLPSAANPGIPTGGLIGESKCAILDELRRTNPKFVADAYLVSGDTASDRLLSLDRILREHEITVPFILKPDVGQRGAGVKIIRSMRAGLDYLQQVRAPVIVQTYAPGPCEAGIFYYRLPSERRGKIFAITEKVFPFITGDGASTVEELIYADSRAALIAATYLRRFAQRRDEILAPGETLRLVETGNHAQGCIFRDGAHLRTDALDEAIDAISQKIPGFYIGRYDIRYENEQDLKQGRNFQIVELNGASSEATSIYDARNSLLAAYRILFRQWKLVFAIGAANRTRGCVLSSLGRLWHEWRHYSQIALSYPCAD